MEIKGWPDTLAMAPGLELKPANKPYSWSAHQITHALFSMSPSSINEQTKQTKESKSINNTFR